MDLPTGPPSDPAAAPGVVGSATDGLPVSGPERPPAAAAVEPEGTDAGGALDLAERVLDEVEQALARLDQGTYGTCEQCGREVGDERLAEYPTARICAGCAPAA